MCEYCIEHSIQSKGRKKRGSQKYTKMKTGNEKGREFP